MTSVTNKVSMLNSNLVQEDPQDAVQLARTLRRIKRRLLLEQCGVALPYALQSRPQPLHRSPSQDSAESTFRVALSKSGTSMERLAVSSEVSSAAPCVE
ncbi:unnamed protein product [Pseudo-nitzschia multistriata]|uniref:Uncharacterized protein n=1 Tax=Pseudo-nitzschia multistriata TaxID=183589 RepID=A0A448ZTE0_9STRA|nr:unnamed protein product [Pseudo-nitzschia multistriata]